MSICLMRALTCGVLSWQNVCGTIFIELLERHLMTLKSGSLCAETLFDVVNRISTAAKWDWLHMKKLQLKDLIRVHPCSSVIDLL